MTLTSPDVGTTVHMTIVTVSASYGALGSEVGPRLAERLGVPFLDRAIPSEVARAAGDPARGRGGARRVDRRPAVADGDAAGADGAGLRGDRDDPGRGRRGGVPARPRRRSSASTRRPARWWCSAAPARSSCATTRARSTSGSTARATGGSSRRCGSASSDRAEIERHLDRDRPRARGVRPPLLPRRRARSRALPPDDRLDRAAARRGRRPDRARGGEPDSLASAAMVAVLAARSRCGRRSRAPTRSCSAAATDVWAMAPDGTGQRAVTHGERATSGRRRPTTGRSWRPTRPAGCTG